MFQFHLSSTKAMFEYMAVNERYCVNWTINHTTAKLSWVVIINVHVLLGANDWSNSFLFAWVDLFWENATIFPG